MKPERSSARHVHLWILAGLSTLFLVLSLQARAQGEGPGNPKAGRDLFIKKGCILCHSIWETETEKKGPSLSSVGMGRSLYDLSAGIWTHWARMNEMLVQEKVKRTTLRADEFRDLIAYLYYLNYNREPGDARIGGEVFQGKGCARCHAVHPYQNVEKPGMPVYQMSRFQRPMALAVEVWNHGGEMMQNMASKGIPWPRFENREVADLIAFIRAHNAPRRGTSMDIPGDANRGRELFVSKACASCHRSRPGTPATGPDLASVGTPASLSTLIGSLWNHYPVMARTMASQGVAQPRIDEKEMEDLLAYVYWMRAFGLEGNAAEGRSVYRSKSCASCHETAAGQTPAAPSLTDLKASQSVYALLAALWNHGPQMETLMREKKVDWPSLSGEEMRNLIAFFRSGFRGSER